MPDNRIEDDHGMFDNYVQNSVQLGDIPSRNQRMTGRCWIEASLSELEYIYKKNTGEDLPPLSSAYIGYHDLRWKIHIFLRRIYNTADISTDDALIDHWLRKPVQDAGQRAVFMKLIREHGIIPEECVPVGKYSFDTRTMLGGINQKLRHAAFQIRNGSKCPEDAEREVYMLVDRCMGVMPYDFGYMNKRFRPIDFYREIIEPNVSFDEIAFVNCPATERRFDYFYKIRWLYSETEKDSPIIYYNTDIRSFAEMAVLQLKRGFPVWIGVDAEHYADKEKGIFDLGLYHYKETDGIDMELEKGEAMIYRDSMMTHALLLCGADIREGKIRRWCVKNSFGDTAGQNGYAYMSTEWFERYVYQIMIRTEIAGEVLGRDLSVTDMLRHGSSETQRVHFLEAWDPLGCLAEG